RQFAWGGGRRLRRWPDPCLRRGLFRRPVGADAAVHHGHGDADQLAARIFRRRENGMTGATLLERRTRSRGGLIGLAIVALAGIVLPFASAGQPFLLMLTSHALIAAILAL